MLEQLRDKNEHLIELNKNNPGVLEKQLLIKKLLKNKDCFFKMNIETAYSILKDLEIDNIKDTYSDLIDIKNYPLDNEI